MKMPCISYGKGVCPSFCLSHSVTLGYSIKTTHSTAQMMHLSEPATEIRKKIDSYYQQHKCCSGTW